jgi:hypothetical protein
MRRLAILIPLCLGCDISTRTFAGTVMQMSLNADRTAPGEHLEFWARTRHDDVVRLSTLYGDVEAQGFVIRPAISMGDPCMIDERGHLLTTAAAYQTVVVNGVEQNPEEQAAQVRTRISQLTSTNTCDDAPVRHCGRQASDMLGVLSYTASSPPMMPFDTPSDERLQRCQAYWQDPLAYTPNPALLIAPLHGPLWGYVSYVTTNPPSGFDSLRLDIPLDLRGLRELFVTVEDSSVDPLARGPIFLRGTPSPGGRGVVNVNMVGPSASGHASLHVDLDHDQVHF